jgi:hypothetical protein
MPWPQVNQTAGGGEGQALDPTADDPVRPGTGGRRGDIHGAPATNKSAEPGPGLNP